MSKRIKPRTNKDLGNNNRPSVDYRHDSFDAIPLFPGLPITGQGPGGGSGDWSMWQMAMNNGTPGTHQGDQGMWMQSREAHGCCTPAGGCGCGCICGLLPPPNNAPTHISLLPL